MTSLLVTTFLVMIFCLYFDSSGNQLICPLPVKIFHSSQDFLVANLGQGILLSSCNPKQILGEQNKF